MLAPDDVRAIIMDMTGIERFDAYANDFDDDLSYTVDDHCFRINIFHDSHGYAVAIRYIPVDIPSWHDLSIPEDVMRLLHRGRGLIIIT